MEKRSGRFCFLFSAFFYTHCLFEDYVLAHIPTLRLVYTRPEIPLLSCHFSYLHTRCYSLFFFLSTHVVLTRRG